MEVDMLVDKHGNCAEHSSDNHERHTDTEEQDQTLPSLPSSASYKTTSPSAAAEVDLREVKSVHFNVDGPRYLRDVRKYANMPLPDDAIEEVIDRLAEIEKAVLDHRQFVQSQKESGKPLYKWSKYENYPAIRNSARELGNAVANLDEHSNVASFLRQARCYSTSISESMAFVLEVVNKKTETYVVEMDSSTLSEEETARANVRITLEVQQILEYCGLVAERVWAATDRLQSMRDSSTVVVPISSISPLGTVMLSAAIGAVMAVVVAMLTSLPTSRSALAVTHDDNVQTQILGVVQYTHGITNLTQLYTLKFDEMNKRYDDISALSKANSLRIDNIVESLGPPNELGVYYPPAQKSDGQSRKAIEARIKEVSGDIQRQMQHMQKQLDIMRKDIARAEIRHNAKHV